MESWQLTGVCALCHKQHAGSVTGGRSSHWNPLPCSSLLQGFISPWTNFYPPNFWRMSWKSILKCSGNVLLQVQVLWRRWLWKFVGLPSTVIPGCPKCRSSLWSFEPFRALGVVFGQWAGSAHLGIALSVLDNIFLCMESKKENSHWDFGYYLEIPAWSQRNFDAWQVI